MQEFVIEKQICGGKPFFVRENIHTFGECYRQLEELIEFTKECVTNTYYVDNDFYFNIYPPTLNNLIKYTIKVREVTPFEIYSRNKEIKQYNKKVVNLFDYKL